MTDRTPAPRSPVFDMFRGTCTVHGIFHTFQDLPGDYVPGDVYRRTVDLLRADVARLEARLRQQDAKDRGS